jgi:hypothetical protein
MQSFDSSPPLHSPASTPSYSGLSSPPLHSPTSTPSDSGWESDHNQAHPQNLDGPESNQSPKQKKSRGPRRSSREKLESVFALLNTYRWTLKDLLMELQNASLTSPSWASIYTKHKNYIYQDPDYLETNLKSEDWKKMLDAVKWAPVKRHLRKEIRALGKSDCYGAYRGVEDIEKIGTDLLLPVETAKIHAPVFIELLKEVTRPLQPSTRDEPVSRYAFMLYQMCYTQQKSNCDRHATLLGMYLQNAGIRKRAHRVLSTLGVCSGYDHTTACLAKLIDAGAREILRVGTSLTVVTTYDNWEMAEGVNEVRFGSNQTFLSATTGLVNEGADMPETGLSRHEYDPTFQLHTEEIISTGLAENNVQDSVRNIHKVRELC